MYMYKKALYTCLHYTGTGAISHQQEIDFEPKYNYIYTYILVLPIMHMIYNVKIL